MERGAYILPYPRAAPNIMAHVQAGLVAPGMLTWGLDVLLAWFFALFKAMMRVAVSFHTDGLNPEKEPKQRDKLDCCYQIYCPFVYVI
jgi:hypothetical protein